MIVKMNVSIASVNWSLAPGDVVELNDTLAQAWLEGGHAVTTKSTNPNVIVNELNQPVEVEPPVEPPAGA